MNLSNSFEAEFSCSQQGRRRLHAATFKDP
jgi:hypothetical protein